MFCNKCGKQLPDGMLFCNKCGSKISSIYSAGENSPAEAEKDLTKIVDTAVEDLAKAVDTTAQPVPQVADTAARPVPQPTAPVYPNPQPTAPVYPNPQPTAPVYPNPQPAAPVYPNAPEFGAAPQPAQPPQPAVAAGVRCPVCGNALVTGAAFCNVCGNPVGYPQYPQGAVGAKANKKFPLKYIVIPTAIVAVMVIIIVAIVNSAKTPPSVPSENGGSNGGFSSSNEYPSNNGGGNSNGGQSENQNGGGNSGENQHGGNQGGDEPYEEQNSDLYEDNGGGQQNNNEQPPQAPQSVEYTGDKTGTVFNMPQNSGYATISIDGYITTYPTLYSRRIGSDTDILLTMSLDGGSGLGDSLTFNLDTGATPLQEENVYNTRDLKNQMNYVSLDGIYSVSGFKYVDSSLDPDIFDDMMLKILEVDKANKTITIYFYANTHYGSDSHVYEGVGILETY